MANEHTLTLRQADQARSDFAAVEGDLQFIMSQLARLPTRAFVCRIALMTAGSVWTLIAAGALLWVR